MTQSNFHLFKNDMTLHYYDNGVKFATLTNNKDVSVTMTLNEAKDANELLSKIIELNK